MNKIIVIGGLTASGKTKLGVEIAKKFNGELVNADSRQIYRYLDIGTNKDKVDIPIHLVDIINPDESYSVYNYQQAAFKVIDEIISKGKVPILVGGTGLYIDSVIKNYNIHESVDQNNLRAELIEKSIDELKEIIPEEKLNKLNNSDKNNPRRLIRIIEKQIELINFEEQKSNPKYDFLFLYPEYNWEELKIKIEKRVDQMFELGLVNETKKVLAMEYKDNDPGLQIMGYSQVIKCLKGEFDLNKAIELTKFAHKQYAKRQRTWFEGEGRGYDLIKVKSSDEKLREIENFLKI